MTTGTTRSATEIWFIRNPTSDLNTSCLLADFKTKTINKLRFGGRSASVDMSLASVF